MYKNPSSRYTSKESERSGTTHRNKGSPAVTTISCAVFALLFVSISCGFFVLQRINPIQSHSFADSMHQLEMQLIATDPTYLNSSQSKRVTANATMGNLNIDNKIGLNHFNCTEVIVAPPHELLSSMDSSGFLQYTDEQWVRMRAVHRNQSLKQKGLESVIGSEFYQFNWEPTLSCAMEQRIGIMGDGGKWICDAYKVAEAEECNVISVGSNNDWSFEEAMHLLNPRCKIFTFDHTIIPSNVPPYVSFHGIGLGSNDTGKLLTLKSALRLIGLEDKTIDIFKIDCEGCEKDIFREMLKPDLRQILIEIHGASWNVHAFFEAMTSAGYVIFHKEANTYGCRGDCIEYGFIKLKIGFDVVPTKTSILRLDQMSPNKQEIPKSDRMADTRNQTLKKASSQI